MNENFGKITQVIGPVVDVTFEGEGNSVPEIYTALSVARHDGTELMLEVEQQHRALRGHGQYRRLAAWN